MPDPTTKSETAPARPINRWGIGVMAVLQTLLLAFIVIVLNYLSVHYHARLDLSRTADYSLSPSSLRYLGSEALTGRGTPVKWIVACRRSSPFYERMRALAEEYARKSNGRILLERVDPMRSPERMAQVASAYGISMVRDLVIIDARSDDSPATSEDANRIKSLNPHVRLVVADEMAVYATADGKRRIIGFQGEDVLTAALVAAVEGRPRRMALLADKSRLEPQDGPSPRKTLEDLLRMQNVAMGELRVAGLEEVPGDVDGLVLAAPRHDFADDEISMLERYWNRPKSALLVLADPAGVPPKLRAFLRARGVTVRGDRVISRNADALVTEARGVFTRGIGFTRDLAGQSTGFGGASASLEVREGAPDLLNKRIAPMGLIEVAGGFWGETEFGKGGESYDEMKDHGPPMFLAASVTRGAESDDRFAADTSRMVIVSNIDFLDPAHHRAENLDFLASSVNWLVGRESLAGIGPRSLATYKLPLLDAQVSFINRLNLFFLPAFFLLAGAFVWSSRRA